jgi:hypothetical protein
MPQAEREMKERDGLACDSRLYIRASTVLTLMIGISFEFSERRYNVIRIARPDNFLRILWDFDGIGEKLVLCWPVATV